MANIRKNLMLYKLKEISGDASSRKFYRLRKGKTSSIIVKAEQEKYKNLLVYSAVNNILSKNGVLAPKLLNNFIGNSLIEITDLGEKSFLDFIKKKKNRLHYYKKIINILIKMQKIKLRPEYKFLNKKIKFKSYTIKKLHEESDLFFDWYLKNSMKKKYSIIIKKKLKKELNFLYKKLKFKNNFFTHRDFHAANIMIKKKRFGIIDSQDAIIGNPLYDVVSLIDDVRIKNSDNFRDKLIRYYMRISQLKRFNLELIMNDYKILSVQRNLKILGIFVRLFVRDKKSIYLKYIPNTWKLLENRLSDPIFKDLKKNMNYHISLKEIKKFKFK